MLASSRNTRTARRRNRGVAKRSISRWNRLAKSRSAWLYEMKAS